MSNCRLRILVVDDQPIVRFGLHVILSKEIEVGSVLDAGSTEEAIDLLGVNTFDIALVDISLPGRDGFALLELIQRKHPLTKVIIVSVHPEELYAIRCMKAGAYGFVSKTAGLDQLVAAVLRVSAGQRAFSDEVSEKLVHIMQGVCASSIELLSRRELEVLKLIATGCSNSQIADRLFVGRSTVTTYRANIKAKIGLLNTSDIVRYAMHNHLIE